MDHDLEQEITRKAEAAEERISQIVKGEITTHNQHEESDDEVDEELQEDTKAIDVKARASAAVHPFPMPVQQGAKGGKPARSGGQAKPSRDTDDDSGVVELNDKRSKLDKPQLFQLIKHAFCGFKVPVLPPVEHIFTALADDQGNRQMAELIWEDETKTKGILKTVSAGYIEHHIAQYMTMKLAATKAYSDMGCHKSSDVVEVRNLICMGAVGFLRDEIPLTLEKSEKGICFHRLPFDIPRPDWLKDLGDDLATRRTNTRLKIDAGELGETPVFDELLSRMTNADAVRAFIGSLLDKNADRAQMLFMYGKGRNGKGRLIKALGKLFEGAHTASSVMAAKSQFFMADIANARLLTFGECDDYKFPVSDLMKSITGDDRHTINIKNQPQFMADIRCRVIFASNVTPTVKRSLSNTRRILYTEVAPLPEGTKPIPEHIYDGKLWNEAERWLAKCWAYYVALCPDGGSIPQDEDVVESLVSASEETMQEFTDTYLTFDPTKTIGVKTLALSMLLKNKTGNAKLTRPLIDFLESRYGIRYMNANRVDAETGERAVRKALWGVCIKKEHQTGIEMGRVERPWSGMDDKTFKSLVEKFYPVGFGV